MQLVLQHVVHPADGLLVRQLAEHEGAPARLLHHLGAVVAGNLAERLVAVHYGVVDYLCVRQKETAVGCKYKFAN